jgi:hypothetical protein
MILFVLFSVVYLVEALLLGPRPLNHSYSLFVRGNSSAHVMCRLTPLYGLYAQNFIILNDTVVVEHCCGNVPLLTSQFPERVS